MSKLTQERLKEVLDYDPETGEFYRKEVKQWWKFGDKVKYNINDGYKKINVDSKLYLAHRLAWLYIHGYFPEYGIDHINRIRGDNRILNLREVAPPLELKACIR